MNPEGHFPQPQAGLGLLEEAEQLEGLRHQFTLQVQNMTPSPCTIALLELLSLPKPFSSSGMEAIEHILKEKVRGTMEVAKSQARQLSEIQSTGAKISALLEQKRKELEAGETGGVAVEDEHKVSGSISLSEFEAIEHAYAEVAAMMPDVNAKEQEIVLALAQSELLIGQLEAADSLPSAEQNYSAAA